MITSVLLVFLTALGCKGDAPVAEIIDPIDGAEFQLGETVTFTATLSDDRSPVGFLNPVWSSNIGGTLQGTKSFEGSETSITVVDLSEGNHTITLELTDPEDNVSQDTISMTVLPNAAPTVTFSSPAQGEEFSLQDTNHADIVVMFEDVNEDAIRSLSLVWSGDIETASSLPENPNGDGSAQFVIGSLEPGDYTVGVEATDSYGGVGSGEISFTVINVDLDGDGYLDEAYGGDDCDDRDSLIYPGATERCDGEDNNCDGVVDEPSAADARTWYADVDGDGFGDPDDTTVACDQPDGTATNAGDCDDDNPSASPILDEVCDGFDNNCDDDIDEDDVCNISLGSDSQARFLGVDSNDQAGWSVAHAGDVNGDGDGDFFIGAPDVAGDTTMFGAAYLVLGPVSGDKDLSFANKTFSGYHTAHRVGEAVDGGVDLNGDGYDDMLYAGIAENTNGAGSGAVVLVSGASSISGITETATWYGNNSYDYTGLGIAMLGQVSGLVGQAVAIGAPQAENGSAELAGAVYIDTSLSGDLEVADATVTIRGNADDLAGFRLIAQDLDGNGMNGLALTAIGDQSEAGVVYLFDSLSAGEHSISDADAQLIGARNGDLAGYSLASGGDYNGDGYDDLIVGAPAESTASTDAGAAYLMLGPISGSTSLASADAIFRGEGTAHYAGWSVGLGDVNADGLADAFVGAPESSDAFENAGVVYTIWGTGLVTGTTSLGDLEPRLEGQLSNEFAGESIDIADADGDGKADLLIGASGNRTNGTQAGAVYLLAGDAF